MQPCLRAGLGGGSDGSLVVPVGRGSALPCGLCENLNERLDGSLEVLLVRHKRLGELRGAHCAYKSRILFDVMSLEVSKRASSI